MHAQAAVEFMLNVLASAESRHSLAVTYSVHTSCETALALWNDPSLTGSSNTSADALAGEMIRTLRIVRDNEAKIDIGTLCLPLEWSRHGSFIRIWVRALLWRCDPGTATKLVDTGKAENGVFGHG